ncbi:hypothetical protein GQR58_029559 [Nymphon striatum]|nr:hypothetical protein GQR58_029559 [Nymphon striatum]
MKGRWSGKLAKSGTMCLFCRERFTDQENSLRIVGRDLPCDPSCDVESELIRCEEDLQYLENQPNPLEELKKKEHSLKSDIHDFDKYLHDLQEHSQRKETDIENLKFEVENLKTVVDAQRKQVEEKENIVKAHNVSEHDIERLRRHKEELQHQLARHIKETNEYDKELNEMQIEIANLTGVVCEYFFLLFNYYYPPLFKNFETRFILNFVKSLLNVVSMGYFGTKNPGGAM